MTRNVSERLQGIVMNKRKLLTCTFLSTVFLAPASAFCEEGFTLEGAAPREAPLNTRLQLDYNSQIQLRLGYISDQSFKYGEYDGLQNDGAYVIGNANLRWSNAWNSDSTRYFTAVAHNVGIDSQQAHVEYGQQGLFSVFVDYDQIPKQISDRAQTPFIGAGSETLTLPAVWQPSNSTAGMTDLNASLLKSNIDHHRDALSVGGSLIAIDDLTLKFSYTRENKDGDRTIGAVIGSSGGNPRAAVVPEPINYTTQMYDFLVDYNAEHGQGQLRYHRSKFHNSDKSLTWDNPYCDDDTLIPGCTGNINGWALAASYPTGQGRLATPPDNTFDQVSFTGAFELTNKTRANLTLSRGWMKQDDPYFAYTVNPGLAVPIPLPQSSLDGKIVTTLVNFGITSRPLPKLDFKLNAKYDDRNNKTNRNEYFVVHGDAADQDTEARINLPYSYTKNELRADAGYRVLPRTRMEAGYEYTFTDRDYQEVGDAKENIVRFGVISTPADNVNFRLRYEHGKRDAENYDGLRPAIDSHEPGVIDPLDPVSFENHPLMRKAYEADRTRNHVNATINVTPNDLVSLDINANYTSDDYTSSPLGMQTSNTQAYTADATFTPDDWVSGHLFYTFEMLTAHVNGWQFSGGGSKLAQSTDANRKWFYDQNDVVHTVGTGVDVSLLHEDLKLSLDYMFALSDGHIDMSTGPALSSAPLPDLETNWQTVSFEAEYFLREDLSMSVEYQYTRYDSDNWAIDNVAVDTLANVISLDQLKAPEYAIHALWITTTYRF